MAEGDSCDVHPPECGKCGATEFEDVDSDLGHAILTDGTREYWIISYVKCRQCGTVYAGHHSPLESEDQNVRNWRNVD
jgi:rubredoxin